MPELIPGYDDWKLMDGTEHIKHGPKCHSCGNEIDDEKICIYCGNPYHRGCLHTDLLLEREKELQHELDEMEMWADEWPDWEE